MNGKLAESSRVKSLEKSWMKGSAIELDVTSVVPSRLTRGGKDDEVKFLEVFFWWYATNLWRNQSWQDFDFSYWWESFWQVVRWIWCNSRQIYKERDCQEPEGSGTFCELYLWVHENKRDRTTNFRMWKRESEWNMCHHPSNNHLCSALGTAHGTTEVIIRGVSDLLTVIISREIRRILHQVVP